MSGVDLRPLSLGEILDRTFTLYRRNFLLFLGITAIPHLFVLALNIAQAFVAEPPKGRGPGAIQPDQFQGALDSASGGMLALGLIGILVGVVVYMMVYLYSQGGTVFAVSDLYLGRPTSITASWKRMRGELGNLFGVLLLNGLAIMGAMVLLIIPGIYLACRLLPCVPAALLENIGPRASLERSFQLTKDFAGRAFVIYLLYFCILYAAVTLFMMPFAFVAGLAAKNLVMYRFWLGVSQVGAFAAGVLVNPILTIATAVFYYDLRVRKEAFDLQYMMNPMGAVAAGSPGVPRMLS